MKYYIFLLSMILATNAISQNTTNITFEKNKLDQAKAYGDKAVITSTIYNLIALEGPQSTYKDSLAFVYFGNRQYVSSFLVIEDVLKRKPNDTNLLEMKAISLESMGAIDKAREAYELLFSKTNLNFHAFKIAGLQLGLKKNDEAYATIKKADQLPDKGELKVTYSVNQNYNENIDLKPAIAFLEGLIAESLDKKVEAKAAYERALKLSPEFRNAKSKLEVLKSQLAN